MWLFVIKSTIPDVLDLLKDGYLAKTRHYTLTPNVHSHMVPSAHLLPIVYIMAPSLITYPEQYLSTLNTQFSVSSLGFKCVTYPMR